MSAIADRVAALRERIATAAARAGRDPAGVTLVAVTKTVGTDEVEALLDAGLRDFGENRVQDGLGQREALRERRPAAGERWHLIGHLQRNKARRALAGFERFDALDNLRLARRLSALASEASRVWPVLLQVNVAGDPARQGFGEEELLPAARAIVTLPGLRIEGLMAMAPFTRDERVQRAAFRRTAELQAGLAAALPALAPVRLSMGMSNDFEVAVEEGATELRLGRTLFEDAGAR